MNMPQQMPPQPMVQYPQPGYPPQPYAWAPQKPASNWTGRVLLIVLLIAPLVAGVTWCVLVEMRLNALQQTITDGVKKDMAELHTQMKEYRESVDATREQLIRTAEAMDNVAKALSEKEPTAAPAANGSGNRLPR